MTLALASGVGAVVLAVAAETSLDRVEAAEVIEAFRTTVAERSAYAAIADDRWRRSLDALKASLDPQVSRSGLERSLRQALSLIGDSHAGVRDAGDQGDRTSRRLPLRLVPLTSAANAPIVALWADRDELVSPSTPFLESIDDASIEAWISAAATEVPLGSPQCVRRRAARSIESLGDWRGAVTPEVARPAATLRLGDGQGTHTALTVALSSEAVRSGPKRPSAAILTHDVGYIRLPEMDERAARFVQESLDGWKDLRGLIVDVRGNGGGSRDALRELASRALAPDTAVVCNAVRPLLVGGSVPDAVRGALDARDLRPVDDAAWNEAELAAIAKWHSTFQPKRAIPDERFGPLHVMVLRGDPARPRLTVPIVILQDSGCFSATDIFLASMGEIASVTLLGQSSSGGSGAAVPHALPHGFETRLSSMVSFRANGALLDGFGVPPDIDVAPTPADIVAGGRDPSNDTLVRAALARLVPGAE
jgi:hypothetical protein